MIRGAVIVRDDYVMQFAYREQCPYCGNQTSQVSTGVAYPGNPFIERCVCGKCGKVFELRIERNS